MAQNKKVDDNARVGKDMNYRELLYTAVGVCKGGSHLEKQLSCKKKHAIGSVIPLLSSSEKLLHACISRHITQQQNAVNNPSIQQENG